MPKFEKFQLKQNNENRTKSQRTRKRNRDMSVSHKRTFSFSLFCIHWFRVFFFGVVNWAVNWKKWFSAVEVRD